MQSSRYPHWLEQSGEGRWPTGIICVDCQSELVEDENNRTRCNELLLSWHAVGMVRRANDYGSVVCTSGRDVVEFWSTVAEQADRHNNLWLLSYRCARVWSLLGLWEMIEDGRVDITSRDTRNSYRNQLGLPSEANGYIVCEDPPNIIKARVYGAQYPITWIDVRNHGVEQVCEVVPGHATAEWLSKWVAAASLLCRKLGLGALAATAGSQAMRAFRHTYYSGGIYCDTDRAANRIIESGYHGGRCEARFIGSVKTPHVHLDFRSAYGAVCVHHRLPVCLSMHHPNKSGEAPSSGQDLLGCVAVVTLRTTEPAYPYRVGSVTWYPTGRFTTVLCGPELEDAEYHGRIERWGEYCVYIMDHALRHYGTCLYNARELAERSNVPGIDKWIKRLLVSLPGKMGQRSKLWVDAPETYSDLLYGEWQLTQLDGRLVRMRSLAGLVQREVTGGFAADAVPATAAWVTSWGRMALLNAIRTAGWEEVYYYDTDSIICSEQGYASLRTAGMCAEKTLGMLELRHVPAHTEIRGIKYYVEDGVITCAGLPRGQMQDLGDGEHFTRRLSPTEQARKGHRPEAQVIYCTYQRTPDYALGALQPDGTVLPPHVWED